MTALVISAIVFVLLVFFVIGTYNNLVTMRQNVKEAWSAIETELRRRFDLIPNLVETVKGYASHEHDTLEDVIKARNSAISNISSPEAMAASQNILTGALTKLMALSEAYPQLKANENFNQLQNELGDTETRISSARRFYNANVKDFNSAVMSFPSVMFAGSMGFHPEPYFGIDNAAAYEPVAVSFSASKPQDSPQVLKINPQKVEEHENK